MALDTKPQEQRPFWDWTKDRSRPDLPPPPTDLDIRTFLSENNRKCPLNKIVVSEANRGNMRMLRRFAFTALKRFNHSLRGCNFGIYAQSGQGKTFIAKCFAETVGIPFILVQSDTLTDTYSLFQLICAEFKRFGTPVVRWKNGRADYTIPPCILLFDEGHLVPKNLMKGGLLNGMESDDGFMAVNPPGLRDETFLVDCRLICWTAATTERGLLFDAFENRLSTAIEWHPATREELPLIVKAGLDRRVESGELTERVPLEACQEVAKYRKVPRDAVSFGVRMVQHRQMSPTETWEDCAKIIAEDMGLDEKGWSKKQIAILKALGQRPIAEPRLTTVAKCRIEQVRRYELPGLMGYDDGGPYVVAVAGKGMCITEAGVLELERRGFDHGGEKVTAEYFEAKRAG